MRHALGRRVEQIDGVALAGEGQAQRQADVAAAADDGQRTNGQRTDGNGGRVGRVQGSVHRRFSGCVRILSYPPFCNTRPNRPQPARREIPLKHPGFSRNGCYNLSIGIPIGRESRTSKGGATVFDRISASFGLARSSWDVLRKNKQLLVFPVLSGIGFIVVLLSFLIPLGTIAAMGGFKDAFDQNGEPETWASVLGACLLFAFYLLTSFVIVFCNAALVQLRRRCASTARSRRWAMASGRPRRAGRKSSAGRWCRPRSAC